MITAINNNSAILMIFFVLSVLKFIDIPRLRVLLS